MLWLAWFVLKETVYPDKVLTGGGQLPLGGMEITSKSFKERRIQTHFQKKKKRTETYMVCSRILNVLCPGKKALEENRRQNSLEMLQNFIHTLYPPLKPPIVVPKM